MCHSANRSRNLSGGSSPKKPGCLSVAIQDSQNTRRNATSPSYQSWLPGIATANERSLPGDAAHAASYSGVVRTSYSATDAVG